MTRAIAKMLAAATVLAAGPVNYAVAQDAGFDIVRFQVEGNSLLPAERVQELVAPFIGKRRIYGDVQKALEALESDYRRLGYGTVQVYVPEQELTSGVVRLQVSEGVVGKVTVTGNKYFNIENVRAGLPQLQEGKAPNMRQLSENVQLSNENPAKQLEVTLGTSEEEGKVDVRVEVKEEDPARFYVTLDNTGTKATGKNRIGISYQNANVGNRDQVLTLAYTTAIDVLNGEKKAPARSGVKVDIFSIGYRVPLYSIGDSIDFIYGNSGTNTPASVLAPDGLLALNGKGTVMSLRYNHIFPRAGEYSSKLVMGLDYKYFNSRCTTNGVPTPIDPPGVSAGCTPYTLRPVTATYSGQVQKPGQLAEFNVGLSHHLFPMGSRYPFPAGANSSDRYSFVTTRQTSDTFTVFRAGGSYSASIAEEWLGRAAFSGQYAQNPLPSGEQIGLTGSTAVRGFLERAVATDRGYVANFELYTPDYASKLGLDGTFKALVFYDQASGQNMAALAGGFARTNVASTGIGFRYNLKKDISARFDLAYVLEGHQPIPGSAETARAGDVRGHVALAFGF